MKKLLMFLIVAGALAYGGYRGGAWYITHTLLVDARQALADDGVLSWGRIHPTLDGEVVIEGLSYQSFAMNPPISSNRAVVSFGSAGAVVQWLMDSRRWPAHWQLRLDDFGIALDQPLQRDWMQPQDHARPPFYRPLCGAGGQRLTARSWQGMGLPELRGVISLERQSEGLYIHWQGGVWGSFDAHFPDAALRDPLALREGLDGLGERVELTFRDAGLMRRVTAYCSRASDLEPEAWLTQAQQQFSADLAAYGWSPSGQLASLYRVWLREGGELQAAVSLTQDALGLPLRSATAPEDWRAPWQPAYNGAMVPDVYLVEKAVAVMEEPAPMTAAVPAGPGFRDAPVTEAARWIDRQVRVSLVSGRVVEGRLIAADSDQLNVGRMMDGGEMGYQISLRGIENFQVWRQSPASATGVSE
ncbi:MAG: hypothetical protein LAT63_05775 [Marinobacter sp.]|nr:hypothetical protein [Marinobacter sp.]